MLKLQTPVTDQPCKVGISYNDRIMMLGSCFSDNIGRQLRDFGFDVCINPFGTLYNPISILKSIERLSAGTQFRPEDCVQIGAGDQRWCSFSHHTSFARPSKEDFLSGANEALSSAQDFFASCNKIIITLGTAWCFRHVASDSIVSNCLKRPSAEFVRERMSPAEVTSALDRIAGLCRTYDEEYTDQTGICRKQLIFTVSPIRHFKDGAHGNQISKATLLLGTEDFLSGCPESNSSQADYFPAYEIMMDELRDYRFYSEDMCHPSQQAADYIRERFLEWALPASERPALEENIRRFRHSQHRSASK